MDGVAKTVEFAGDLAGTESSGNAFSESYFVKSAREELAASNAAIGKAYETITENPKEVGTAIVNSVVETGAGIIKGDPGAIARGTSAVTEVIGGGGVAGVGAKVGGQVLIAAGKGVKKVVDKTRAIAKRISEKVGDVPNSTLRHQASSGVILKAEPGKTTTILGSYNKDMASIIDELGNVKSMDFGPKPGGFNVLNAPDELFTSLGPKGFWNEVNVPFLNSATARGDNILMATKPAFEVVDNRGMSVLVRPNATTGKMELTGFGKEYLTLRKQGLVYRDGKMVTQQ